MGKKYIIEMKEGERIYKTKLNALNEPVIREITCEPYAEPDLEQVRKEAYEKGWKEAEDHYEKGYSDGYDTGLSDAWECARKIVDCAIPYSVLENYLEIGECTADVIKHLPASKAIEVVRQYEQEKDAEIKVGDEVKAFERKPFIVTGFGYGDEDTVYCHGFVTENGISTITKKDECVKTGRHFPEIVEILQKMKWGEQDD